MSKLNLLVICGGESFEHEVSIQSARSVLKNLNKTKYNINLVCIGKNGLWYWMNELHSIFDYPDYKPIPQDTLGEVCSLKNPSTLFSSHKEKKIDVAFPVLHGFKGEDGAIQGFLKVCGIPFVGSDVLSSAICMDKHKTKIIVNNSGIPIAKYFTLVTKEDSSLHGLDFPVFVKPANSGSSIGISKAKSNDGYKKAIELAFKHDSVVLVEECIEGLECEVSLLGNHKVRASRVGAIIPENDEFYSYNAKYIDSNGAKLQMPASFDEDLEKKIQDMAIKIFKILNCRGMARVDFFVKKNKDIIFNEINTIPGFTEISMYPGLWKVSGLSYSELLDELIVLAKSSGV